MLPITDDSSTKRLSSPTPKPSKIINPNLPSITASTPKSLLVPSSVSAVHPRTFVIISILFLQALLLLLSQSLRPFPTIFSTRGRLPSSPTPTISLPYASSLTTVSAPAVSIPLKTREENHTEFPQDIRTIDAIKPLNRCEFGKFFVYDIPPELNTVFYRECDRLNPWGSLCDKLSNDGYGPSASTAISRVVPKPLADAWYWTDQFSSEVIFHNRLLHHECRTTDPNSASAFYIPFYAGLAVGRYLWSSSTLVSAKERDRHCDMMLDWVTNRQPWFNRSEGWDHFLTMGRITWDFRRSNDNDWGSHCIYASGMRNITRLLIERNPWDYFDVGIPYPTGFHPKSDGEVYAWQEFVRTRERRTLFCFAGATRGFIKNDFRRFLIDQCRGSGEDKCRLVDCSGSVRCSNGTTEIMETFLDSEFCLQPRGDSFTRRSIFDCMLAGSIPVFFWRRTAYYQYEWYLPGEPESYSVFIHRDSVKNGSAVIKEVLGKYGKEEVRRMREKVIEVLPKLVYARSGSGLERLRDAVDVAVEAVLRRAREQKVKGYRW